MDLFRCRCYLASLQGGEPPNPKRLLGFASRPTKLAMGRLSIFSVSSFHALVCSKRSPPTFMRARFWCSFFVFRLIHNSSTVLCASTCSSRHCVRGFPIADLQYRPGLLSGCVYLAVGVSLLSHTVRLLKARISPDKCAD